MRESCLKTHACSSGLCDFLEGNTVGKVLGKILESSAWDVKWPRNLDLIRISVKYHQQKPSPAFESSKIENFYPLRDCSKVTVVLFTFDYYFIIHKRFKLSQAKSKS